MEPSELLAQVQREIESDLPRLDADQLTTFKKHAILPYCAPISRYGCIENVVVVARNGDEVIYWEDVEEGFNVSPVGQDGRILEHWCNQDDLGLALNSWIHGRQGTPRLGPAQQID